MVFLCAIVAMHALEKNGIFALFGFVMRNINTEPSA